MQRETTHRDKFPFNISKVLSLIPSKLSVELTDIGYQDNPRVRFLHNDPNLPLAKFSLRGSSLSLALGNSRCRSRWGHIERKDRDT